MGLFSKKSDEQKRAENRIEELCGGFLGNDAFRYKLQENNLGESTSNTYYKSILKDEIKNQTLDYDDIEARLDELMKLDVDALNNKIKYKQDTSLFKTQQDINDFLGAKYAEKHNRSIEKSRVKNLEKERKRIEKEKQRAEKEEAKRIKDSEKERQRAEKEEAKRIKDSEKERQRAEKEEAKRIKNLEKQKDKIRKIEEKFNIDLTGKTWFECTIEEVKFSTFQNQANRNIDTAYVIINKDNVEILKESYWIKSNMGTRKIFYDNITSIDYDARGKFHLSSGMIINTKSAEHIQLKHVSEENYNILNDAFENHMKKPSETTIISQSSKADDLVKYAELYEKGLISENEFNKLKNEIIHGGSDSNFSQDINLDNKNRFCTNCGFEVELDAKFCPNCGTPLKK